MNEEYENSEYVLDGDYDTKDDNEHIASGYQPLKNTKKTAVATTCLTLAGLLAAGLIGAHAIKKLKKPVEIPEASSITETEPETEVQMDHGNLILWEDFDIENKDEVRKRAQAIYDISEKKYSVDEIVNMIYYFNGKSEYIVFPNGNSEDAKFKYLQNLGIHISDLLDDNLQDDLDRMYSLLDKEKEEDDVLANDDYEIYAYMFMASDKTLVAESMSGEQVEFTAKGPKTYAIELALEVEKQLDAIRDGNVESFDSNAQGFYTISSEITKLKDAPDGYMVIMIDDYKTKLSLYPGDAFTKEQKSFFEDTKQDNYLNSLGFDASKKTGASYDANKGNKATTTPVTERRVEADKAKAENRPEAKTTVKLKEPVVLEQGGKKVTTSKQTIVTPGTTKVEVFTFVASTTKPVTTETTIIEKGGEVVSERYVDSDAKDAEKYATEVVTEPTTQIDEQNTTKYVDSESTTVIVLDEGGQKVLS